MRSPGRVIDLDALVARLRASRGIAHKRDIADVVATLGIADPDAAVAVGDDGAAIRDGDGWLLLAIEGFMNEFVAAEPHFAGWCGAMVNLSDIYAMGGRPLAIVDALPNRSPLPRMYRSPSSAAVRPVFR